MPNILDQIEEAFNLDCDADEEIILDRWREHLRVSAVTNAGTFEESAHPRNPKGSDKGGEFASKSAKSSTRGDADVLNVAQKVGLSKEQVVIDTHDRVLHDRTVFAYYSREDGKVHVTPAGLKRKEIESIMVHEGGHVLIGGDNSILAAGIKKSDPKGWEASAWQATKNYGHISKYMDVLQARYGGLEGSSSNYNLIAHEAFSELHRLHHEGKLKTVSKEWQAFYSSTLQTVKTIHNATSKLPPHQTYQILIGKNWTIVDDPADAVLIKIVDKDGVIFAVPDKK